MGPNWGQTRTDEDKLGANWDTLGGQMSDERERCRWSVQMTGNQGCELAAGNELLCCRWGACWSYELSPLGGVCVGSVNDSCLCLCLFLCLTVVE